MKWTRLFFFFPFFLAVNLCAYPCGHKILSGNVNVSHQDSTQRIQIDSDLAKIFWEKFSIAKGEEVTFLQPSENSVAINLISPQENSTIAGNLVANGHLVLINPAGIIVTENGSIQAASLLASTLEIKEETFAKDDSSFIGKTSEHPIQNEGTILAKKGDVTFLASHIEGSGAIKALQGKVAFLSHNQGEIYIQLEEIDKRVYLRIPKDTINQAKHSLCPLAIRYQGEINTSSILFTTEGRVEIAGKMDLQNSTLEASSIMVKGENIHIKGEKSSPAYLGAKQIELVSENSIELTNSILRGKNIQLEGQSIILDKDTLLDVSHPTSGGQITLLSTYQTLVEESVRLIANATHLGKGGTIYLASKYQTAFHGKANICGGSKSGKGGILHLKGNSSIDIAENGLVLPESPEGAGTVILDSESDIFLASSFSTVDDSLPSLKSPFIFLEIDTLMHYLPSVGVTIKQSHKDGGTITTSPNTTFSYSSPHTLCLQTEEKGNIYFLSSFQNMGMGDSYFYAPSGHIVFSSSSLQMNGTLSLGSINFPSEQIDITESHLQTVKEGMQFYYAKNIHIQSGPKAKATIQSEEGNIHLRTDHLTLKGLYSNPAAIHITGKGKLFQYGLRDHKLGSLTIHAQSGKAKIETLTAELEGKLALIGEKEEAILYSPEDLSIKASHITLLANDGNASIYAEGNLHIYNSGDLELTAENGPSTVRSDQSLFLKIDGDIELSGNSQQKAAIEGRKGLQLHADNVKLQANSHIYSPRGMAKLISNQNIELTHPFDIAPPSITARKIDLYAGNNLLLSENAFLYATSGFLRGRVKNSIYFYDNAQATVEKGNIFFYTEQHNIHFTGTSKWVARDGGIKVIAGRSIILEHASKLLSYGEEGIQIITGNADAQSGLTLAKDAEIHVQKGALLQVLTTHRRYNKIYGKINGVQRYQPKGEYNTREEQWDTSSLKDSPHLEEMASLEANDPIRPSFTLYYRSPGEVVVGGEILSAADFSKLLINFIGPFTAELFRNLHPYNEFTDRSIEFYDCFNLNPCSLYSIKRRTFDYTNPPPLLREEI